MEDAKKAGIPVINVNDGLIANADSFVGPKADQNGELAAEWIADKLGGKGKGGNRHLDSRTRRLRLTWKALKTGWRPTQRTLRLWQSRMLTGTVRNQDLADTWIKQYIRT